MLCLGCTARINRDKCGGQEVEVLWAHTADECKLACERDQLCAGMGFSPPVVSPAPGTGCILYQGDADDIVVRAFCWEASHCTEKRSALPCSGWCDGHPLPSCARAVDY